MQPNSPSAFLLSAVLHSVIAGLVLFFTYGLNREAKDPPRIFELVAGEGDNYLATEAPALGVEGGIKLAMPEIPVITPAPLERAPAAPEPVIERAPVVTPAPPPKAPAETVIRNFSKDVKRISSKRQANLEAAEKKKRDAAEREAARKAKEEALKSQRMTKEDFDRQNKKKGAPAPKAGARVPKVAKIDAEGIARGVIGGSTANKIGGAGGKALTRSEGDALDLYFSLLKRRLHEALDRPPGLADSLVAVAEFRIAANGMMSEVRIKRSSGSKEFDDAVLEAFARVRSVGPRPDRRSEVVSLSFRMREVELE